MRKTLKSQDNIIEKLKSDVNQLRKEKKELIMALNQIKAMTDHLLAATAEKYGEQVEDYGYRLQIPIERVRKVLDEYEVRVDRNDIFYTFGMLKNENNGSTGELTETGI